MNKKRCLLSFLITFSMVTVSCQGKVEEGGLDGDASNSRTLTISPDRTSLLRNPLNGWVMYVSGSSDPSYFDTKIYVPELGKEVFVRDYVSACYIRTGWKAFNPADGQYAWNDPDSRLYKIIARAEELGIPRKAIGIPSSSALAIIL